MSIESASAVDNNTKLSNHKKNAFIGFVFLYVILILLSIILPLVLWRLRLTGVGIIVGSTRPDGIPFELFGGIIAFVLIFIAFLEIKRKDIHNLANVLPIVLGLLVSLSFLLNISESTFGGRFNSDYIAFEKGAKAISSGISPYIDTDNPYVYPPLVGQVMAFLHQIVVGLPFFQIDGKDQGWQIVFYLFQCTQLLLLIFAYFLTYKFSKIIGAKAIPASLIVAALFLFNNSVVRTLNFHQTNLWILNSFLIGFLLQKTYPWVSGIAVALGIHIKMYPFILIAPWIALRKWTLLIATTTGLLVIAFLQSNFGQNWTLLQYFFDYLKGVSKPTPYRNNSINSIIYNFLKIPNKFFGTSLEITASIVSVITLVILVWFLIRFMKREKIYRELSNHSDNKLSKKQYSWSDMFRFYGHSMDAIALGLLISPSVFEHHYIVLIPVALWSIVTCDRQKLVAISIGISLVFCIPTFDLFPLSFHRLFGLLMIVYFTSPDSLSHYFAKQINANIGVGKINQDKV